MAVSVRVQRISHPRAGLRAYMRRLGDFRPAWNPVADVLANHFGRVFASEGAELGRRWPELREPYRSLKARTHAGHPILTKEAELRNSMAERNAPGHVERFSRQAMEYGTSVAHARTHHFGAGQRGLRSRAFAHLNARVVRVVRREVSKHVTGGV
jgi:hypothetical protein